MITAEEIIKIRKATAGLFYYSEIADRFSPRYFSNEKIELNDINSIFEAARFAPSGWNFQPWYFYWTKRGANLIIKIISCLPKYNRFSKTAPILIIGCLIKESKGEKHITAMI